MKLTWEQANSLFLQGVIGTKEYRSWLSENYPDFNAIKDADVDAEIERMAAAKAAAMGSPLSNEGRR